MKVNTDCRFYLAYKPCKFHKIDRRHCDNCSDYDPIKKRILIIKLDALGDVLRTTSILPALKKRYPQSEITWITRKNAFSILKGNEYIDRLFAVEENFLQYIQGELFNIGLCLDADTESASILTIAKCNIKKGFFTNENGKVIPVDNNSQEWHEMGINDDLKKNNRKTYQQIIYEICGLNNDIELPQFILDDTSVEFGNQFFKQNKLKQFDKILGINTGGGKRWQFKKWIQKYYSDLIVLIKQQYPNHGIILMGGPEEVEFNDKILKEVGGLVIDAGCNNSIKEFGALISFLDLCFTPDSLGMHISIALQKTTIVNVGPTSPWELSVYGNGEIIYNEALDCIACYKSLCDLKVNCMNTLEPKIIMEKMNKYL